MDKILHFASDISQPLGIAGILAAATFLIFRQIIQKNIFPTLTKNLSADIITLIIKRLSMLALVSMVLGFAGFALSLIYKQSSVRDAAPAQSSQEITFSGRVMDAMTAQIIEGAEISVRVEDKVLTDTSDSKGIFVVKLRPEIKTVDLTVVARNYAFYVERAVPANSFKQVSLNKIVPAKNDAGFN
jgi:hypothetical protein